MSLILHLTLTVAVGQQHSKPDTDPRETLDIAVVSQGGVSLGAYEAGVNWALVELLHRTRAGMMNLCDNRTQGDSCSEVERAVERALNQRKPKIVAATGASAGNINTFLTLLAWDANRPTLLANNWYWQTWVPMGIDHLLPDASTHESRRDLEYLGIDPNNPYDRTDGLLSRAGFRVIEEKIGEGLHASPGGSLFPIAVPINRTTPTALAWAGDATIPSERSVVAFKPFREGDRTRLRNLFGCSDADHPRRSPKPDGKCASRQLGDLTVLPEDAKTHEISDHSVYSVIEASSAVPLAFGPVALNVCEPRGLIPISQDQSCPNHDRGINRRTYIDGGTFDNLPIGLAYHLVDEGVGGDASKVYYLALDVNRRRPRRNIERQAPPIHSSPNLNSILVTLAKLIPTGRNSELRSFARYRAQGAEGPRRATPRVRVSDRYFPVIGQYMAAFGAFFGRPFREYDYYVGVYDGLIYYAQAACVPQKGLPSWVGKGLDRKACFQAAFRRAYDGLGLNHPHRPEERAASYVIYTALKTELQHGSLRHLGGESPQAIGLRTPPALSQMEDPRVVVGRKLADISAKIVVNGVPWPEDTTDIGFAKILGRELIYILGELDKDSHARRALLRWRAAVDSAEENPKAAKGTIPYIERSAIELVVDPETYINHFFRLLLDRFHTLEDEQGWTEAVVELLQFALNVKLRSHSRGFHLDLSAISREARYKKHHRWGRFFAHALIPQGLGWMHFGRVAGNAFRMDLWRPVISRRRPFGSGRLRLSRSARLLAATLPVGMVFDRNPNLAVVNVGVGLTARLKHRVFNELELTSRGYLNLVGMLADSMALVVDAAHNLGDVVGLLLAWGAGRLPFLSFGPSARFPEPNMTSAEGVLVGSRVGDGRSVRSRYRFTYTAVELLQDVLDTVGEDAVWIDNISVTGAKLP